MDCYECSFYYYDECEGCECCHYDQEKQEVEIWLAELPEDEFEKLYDELSDRLGFRM